jgi:DNA invertase Pin-like site-specific DNA recombinase
MTAYGYIRKSVVRDDKKALSIEVQEERVRALAASRGDHELEILTDAGISGAKVEERREYMRLVEAIESGEAGAVYAYDLSRLHRNTKEALRFFELAKARGVPVRLVADNVDTSNAMGQMVLTILSAVNAMVSQVTSEKIKASLQMKRARDGYRHGAPPYGEKPGEDTSVVVEAFREARSFDASARLLNARGVRCRTSKAVWSGSVVASILRRVAPDEVAPSAGQRSAAGRRLFRLSRVLACSVCGHYMTGSRDTRRGDVRYSCTRAKYTPHGRGWVNESKLLHLVQAETERAAPAIRRLQVGSPEDEAKTAELDAERTRVKAMYRKGHMEEPEFDAAMEEIAAAESQLTTRRWIRRMTLTPDIESDDPATVNAYLRRLFERVVVDMSQPTLRGPSKWVPTLRFDWRDPSLADASFSLEYIDERGELGHLARPSINVGSRTLDYQERPGPYPYDRRSIKEIEATDPEYAAVLRAEPEGGPAGTVRRGTN